MRARRGKERERKGETSLCEGGNFSLSLSLSLSRNQTQSNSTCRIMTLIIAGRVNSHDDSRLSRERCSLNGTARRDRAIAKRSNARFGIISNVAKIFTQKLNDGLLDLASKFRAPRSFPEISPIRNSSHEAGDYNQARASGHRDVFRSASREGVEWKDRMGGGEMATKFARFLGDIRTRVRGRDRGRAV